MIKPGGHVRLKIKGKLVVYSIQHYPGNATCVISGVRIFNYTKY